MVSKHIKKGQNNFLIEILNNSIRHDPNKIQNNQR